MVGKLKLVSALGCEEHEFVIPDGKNVVVYKDAHKKLVQWKREVTCALNLVDMIKSYVSDEDSEDNFKSRIYEVCSQLRPTPIGDLLIATLGYCYTRGGQVALGDFNVSGGIVERIQGVGAHATHSLHKSHNLKEALCASLSAQSAMGVCGKAEGQTAREKASAEAAASLAEVMWATTVIDIEELLVSVCFKATHDSSVNKDMRKKRALALILVGEVFTKSAHVDESNLSLLAKTLEPSLLSGDEKPSA